MNLKPLIEKAIADLSNNSNLESIMLQAKTIAHLLTDESFKHWVTCELNGYSDNDKLPEYRIVSCQVRIDIHMGFAGIMTNYTFPPRAIEEKFNNRLFHMPFHNPIAEIEEFISKDSHQLTMQVPAGIYPIMNQVINGNINNARQIISTGSLKAITTTVKSKLLDFFLQLNDQLEIGLDFTKLENREQITHIMNQTINAGIYNSGTAGNIDSSHTNIAVGNGNTFNITPEIKQQLSKLVSDIKLLDITNPAEKQDVNEGLATIEAELQKPEPDGGIIRKTLRLFKSIPQVVVNHAVEIGIDTAIAALIAL